MGGWAELLKMGCMGEATERQQRLIWKLTFQTFPFERIKFG